MQASSLESGTSTWRWAGALALTAALGLGACSQEDQKAVAEKTEAAAEKATAAGAQAVDAAKEAASSTAEAVKENAGAAIDKAKEAVADTAGKAGDMAGKAGDAVAETAGSAVDATKNAADSAADKAAEAVAAATDKAKSMADSTSEAASDAKDKAAGAVADTTDEAKAMTESAGDAAKDKAAAAVAAAKEKAGAAVDAAKEKASDATQSVVDKTSDASSATTGTVMAAAGAAGAAAAGMASSADDATQAAKAADIEPIKAAWVYVGPVGDGGWSFAHDNGRKAVQDAMGETLVSSYVESVPESADAERVLRDLAVQGNKVIFGTTFGYMESMRKLSREFPDVKWEHATGYKTTENMRTYDSRTYQGAYMAGVIAGAMTTSNTLGVVGSIPIPEVLRNINSFTLGAQSSNPDITTKVVWVNKWFDPPREAEAAQSLIDQGADILFQNTDSAAVLQTAEKAGKLAFGWDSDMTAYGPKAHLASAIINWGPYYKDSMQQVLDGSWKTGSAWWGVAEGAIDLVSISDKVPADVRAKVEGVKAGLKGGIFKIWKGPIVDSTGKEVLAAGTVADDKFLGGVNFYVKGVDGQVPSGG